MILTPWKETCLPKTINLGTVETINMLPILVPSSNKRIATQILVIAKLNGRKDLALRGCVL